MEANEKKIQHRATEADTSKKSRKKLLYLFIVFLLVVICGVGSYIFVTSRSGSSQFSHLLQKNILRSKQPILLNDLSKSENISAKKGGQISLTTPQGTNIFLYIPPGALKQDTTLSMTPLEEPPIEGFTEPDPGFSIGPPGIQFNPGAAVVIGGQPPAGQPPGQGANAGQNPAGGNAPPQDLASDIFNQAGLGNLTNVLQTMTISPSETRENQPPLIEKKPVDKPYPDLSVILSIDSGGSVGLIPTSRSDNGSIGGIIKQTGVFFPHWSGSNKNPKDAGKPDGDNNGNDGGVADQAGANGGARGACTPEYMNALIAALNQAKASGNGSGASRYGKALKDCTDQSLDFLKRLCAGDRRLVRRQYFTQRIQAANMLPTDDTGLAAELAKLENECSALYRFSASGETPGSGTYGITMTSSIDATVCGYIDDVWKGNFNYELRTGNRIGFHNLSATGQFQPPANGGYFSGNFRFDSVSTGGIVLAFPAEQSGYFDGQTNLEFMAYPAISLASPIELIQNSCSSEPAAVPLAPGNNSDQQDSPGDLIPLVPLVPQK